MNGGVPLIDKLLATTPAQRSDLVPLKGQAAIHRPDVITDIEAGSNDTRLPSRAAVDRQLGVDASQLAPAGGTRIPVPERMADGASLSTTARIISEIMGAVPSRSEAVRGSVPLWLAAAAPEASQLAAALARSVAGSGLFYESHLLQFFTGQRSLAQLLKEPQAALTLSSTEAPAAANTGPGASHAAANLAAEAIPLVRQQLELLAFSQFRWSGEVWPGGGMEWEITEQGRRQQYGAENAPLSWSTNLTMTLPNLGDIQLRLSLVNDSWRADLAASSTATIDAMRADGEQLRQRFSAAGLHLNGLQVAQLLQPYAKDGR